MDHLFLGSVVHSKSLNELEAIENGFIAVRKGKIWVLGDRSSLPNEYLRTVQVTTLKPHQFLMPGFVDCHIHASQYPILGLGFDLPLSQWLETYAFSLEAAYKDNDFAGEVYEAVVRRTINCGTTLAAYFATNYWKSSLILAKQAIQQGQRAFVGKVCSDKSVPDYYIEKTEDSLRDTESFIHSVLNMNSPLVKPIVAPRFALSCTKEFMKGLSAIASKYDLRIQSHIAENCEEVKAVKETFKADTYVSVYESAKLLSDKCLMAHGVHLEDRELALFKKYGTSIAHCPTSNTKMRSGLCEVQRLINAGIKVGLGTDVSGGHPSILTAIQDALSVSLALNFVKKQNILGTGRTQHLDAQYNRSYNPLEYKQAFYLATLGGASALSLDDVCGNFMVGKEFDALLVDVSADQFDVPASSHSHVEQMIQKFLYSGDDRNIRKVFIAGKQVKKYK